MRKLFYDTSLLCLLILCCPLITSATPRSTLRGFVKIADPSYPSESFIISRKKSPSEFEFFSESGGVTTPVAGLGTLVYGFGELLDSPLSSNGLPDIAVGYGGSLQLLENRGATGFRRTEPLELPDANNATVTTISIDVIDDMREELLSADSGHFTKINSYLSKFTNGYFGLFSPTRGFLPPPLHPDGALDTAKGDVNGDGLDDIVIWNYDSFVVVGYSYALNRSLRVLLNNGDGSFTSSKFPIAAAATNYFPGIAALRDVNRDGALDVIMLRVRPADTLIYVTFNDGNGDFPQALGKLYALGCGSSRWEFEGGGRGWKFRWRFARGVLFDI